MTSHWPDRARGFMICLFGVQEYYGLFTLLNTLFVPLNIIDRHPSDLLTVRHE